MKTKKDWLQRRLTTEEAEARNMVIDSRLGPKAVPFGFVNEKWKALLAQMADGDELWEFTSSRDTWENLCGREGIAGVRDGEVIYEFVTLMS